MSQDKEKEKSNAEDKNEVDFPTISKIEPTEAIGDQIGQYEILEELGEGGLRNGL